MNHPRIDSLLLQALILVSMVASAFGQGTFQDLDFESPILPLVPVAGAGLSYVYASNAMPGWTLYIGTNQTPQVLFNNTTEGSAAVDLLGPGWTNGGIIGGSYSAVLQAGVGQNSGSASTSIAQTGLIPSASRSVLMEEVDVDDPAVVSVDGQNIPMIALYTTNVSGFFFGRPVIVFGGDISAFAGQTEQLEITSPDSPDQFNSVYLDDIQFSDNPVPEPTTCALLVCGAVAFGFNHWRRKT